MCSSTVIRVLGYTTPLRIKSAVMPVQNRAPTPSAMDLLRAQIELDQKAPDVEFNTKEDRDTVRRSVGWSSRASPTVCCAILSLNSPA